MAFRALVGGSGRTRVIRRAFDIGAHPRGTLNGLRVSPAVTPKR